MSPTPESDVIVDLTAVADGAARPAAVGDSFSWNLEGDVLRDLLLRVG